MKFVSLSQLLGCPLFGSSYGLFTVLGFIVSLMGIKGGEGKPPAVFKLAEPVLLVFLAAAG